MTTQEFVLNCMGLYNGTCKYIDNLCEEFDVDFNEEHLKDALFDYYHNYATCGNALIKCCFEIIITNTCEDFNNEDLRDIFNYWCDDYASGIAFDGHEYKSKEELYLAVDEYLKKL